MSIQAAVRPAGYSAEPTFAEESAAALVAAARSLRPLLDEKAGEHERAGELTQEVVEALDQNGLLAMAAPRRIGGLAQSSESMAQVAIELSKGCPSTAWVYTIYNSCLWFASKLPRSIQETLFANGIPRICSPQNGMGQLTPSGDGFELTGRWSYATGSHHAQFTMVPAILPDQQPMLVVLPMAAVSLDHTWDVAGMKGTGSDTVVAEHVPVSVADICSFADISATPPAAVDNADLEPSDFWVNYPLLRAKALGVLVGCAEGLLEQIVAKSGGPIIYSTYTRKSDSGAYQAAIGRAATAILAARRLVEGSCARIDAAAKAGSVLGIPERTEFRGQGALVVQTLTRAMEDLMDLGGSSAFGTANSAQRYWRDFSTAARHVLFNAQISYETVGRSVLGIETAIVAPDML
ncbi:acyl-CoA dehydrogenase family protein [Streptomyces ipomoeae]|uniref:acyl-CoA dehydrogenase family protein n=1 Tax=Streptomyces ipomoeae TaxID=103232 RepID=UPI0015F06541|nr:acyl-CoA dehydrogenase family protein [Streptomyces ipomoeae]MDX2937662.1 acyl-CoA dehydrogenase family protein [Streptomyces ipomoeae]